MRTKQILLFGLVTCSLTGNMACKDADSEKTLCIDNVRMISRVTGDPLPGDTLLNPNNTGPDFVFSSPVSALPFAVFSSSLLESGFAVLLP